MQQHEFDVVIVGGGGAGLRAAIAAAQHSNGQCRIALLSKVYPMRSHTVAAEGGAAAVTRTDDSFEAHFDDTVAGGDWLSEQGVVDYFVRHAHQELVQLEHWGCPWSRQTNGDVQVRRFGGMQTERTWFAADKTGFHMLHTLYQTALQYDCITRFDEYFALDISVAESDTKASDGTTATERHVTGVIALDVKTGQLHGLKAGAVIMATGGAGRVFKFNTNGGIVTGDGMAIAYRNGVALRDMEFVQYHPTGLPGSGILITEASRGEGGVLLNKDGYRYLQDYELGPETPVGEPKNKYMELGPRDKLSQAFWHEQRQGRTGKHGDSDVVYLDLRHLGRDYLLERLPFICELAQAYVNVDPAEAPIPVRPAVHYTMGGIMTNGEAETSIHGLFAAGECASVGLHGANRLGSNSLTELLVFGRLAGERAASRALERAAEASPRAALTDDMAEKADYWHNYITKLIAEADDNNVSAWPELKRALVSTMERGCGIYRDEQSLRATLTDIRELRRQYTTLHIADNSPIYNTDLLQSIELGFSLDVAEAICLGALERKESRGAHQRLEEEYRTRNDAQFLKHSLVYWCQGGPARLEWQPVDTSVKAPKIRAYGDAGQQSGSADQAAQGQQGGNS